MDKFKPALTVPQRVPNGQVEDLKVSVLGVDWAAGADQATELYVNVRQEALGWFWGDLKARLESGAPVVMPADPFRPYRDPTPSEPVTLFLPAGSSGRP